MIGEKGRWSRTFSLRHPHWSADGKLLYFLGGGKVYSAAVRTGDSFESEAPKEITSGVGFLVLLWLSSP